MGHDHHSPIPINFRAPYNGFVPPHLNPFQRRAAVFCGAMTWFWLMYRGYHDYKVVLGLQYPWEHSRNEKYDLDEFAYYEGDEHKLPKI